MMKFIHSVFVISLFFLFSCSEPEDQLTDNQFVTETLCLVEVDGIFKDIELTVKPKYLDGGQEGYVSNFYDEILYPAAARENSVEGLVQITFVITKEGTVQDINIVQDPGTGLGAAAVKAFKAVTEGVSYSPGELNKEKVNVMKDTNVRFRLE